MLELESATVMLPIGVKLIEIQVSRGSANDEFEPASESGRVGDVIRFTAKDGHSHALLFDAAQIPSAAVAFLERTRQLRSPPLLHKGASWVISFEGAPAGEYHFTCATHGGGGRIRITSGP